MKVALGGDCSNLLGFDDLDNEDCHMIEKAFREGKGGFRDCRDQRFGGRADLLSLSPTIAVPDEDRSELAPAPPTPKSTRSKTKKQQKEEAEARMLADPKGAFGGEEEEEGADAAYAAAPGPPKKQEAVPFR